MSTTKICVVPAILAVAAGIVLTVKDAPAATPSLAVGPQYDSTHVYVTPEDPLRHLVHCNRMVAFRWVEIDRAFAERIYLCHTDERDVIANDHARSDRNQPRIRDIQLFEFNSALPHFA
jgi:hypothetical protein